MRLIYKSQRLRIVKHNLRLRHIQRRNAGTTKNRKFIDVQQNSVRRIKSTVKVLETLSLNGDRNRLNLHVLVYEIEYSLNNCDGVVTIDFSETKTCVPCGTLFFKARLEMLINKFPGRLTCTYPVDEIVGQLFQHIGLLEKLGLSNKYTITADNVKCWHVVDGDKADGSKFEKLLMSYSSDLNEPMRMGLFESMSEAVTNTAHHAYDGLENDSSMNRWWLFASKTENILTVAIYDAGMGIAKSLRIKPSIADYLTRYTGNGRKADVKLIRAAIGSNRSKTQLPYRGKGLPDMLTFVKSTRIGGMLIHSNRATYMYSANHNYEKSNSHKYDLLGTLIQWTIPLN